MKDNVFDCVEKLTMMLQGELHIGDHESLSIFGAKEQQRLAELAKDVSRLFVNQGYEIEHAIKVLLEEMDTFNESKRDARIFLTQQCMEKNPESVYGAMTTYIDKLTTELQLQEIQLLKEIYLLQRIEKQIYQCGNDIQKCIDQGEAFLLNKPSSIESDDNYEWFQRLERKINDLKISNTIAKQSLMQIRLLYENNQSIIYRTKELVSNTIPVWRKQMQVLFSSVNQNESDKINQVMKKELKILADVEIKDYEIRRELEHISL